MPQRGTRRILGHSNNRLFVFMDNYSIPNPNIEWLDAATNTWHTGPELPENLIYRQNTFESANGKLYFFQAHLINLTDNHGRVIRDTYQNTAPSKSNEIHVYEFNPDTGVWKSLPSIRFSDGTYLNSTVLGDAFVISSCMRLEDNRSYWEGITSRTPQVDAPPLFLYPIPKGP